MSLFFKGSNDKERIITKVPGFVSTDPEEPVQFMNPGLYCFEFDSNELVVVDDWVNGRDNTKYREILPGVIGKDGTLEVIINMPITMQLVQFDLLDEIINGDVWSWDNHQSLHWLLNTIKSWPNLYGLSEEELIALQQSE